MIRGLIFCSLIFLWACNVNREETDEPEISLVREQLNLMEVDKTFSEMSEQEGYKAAYMEFTDSNVVLLRPYHMPIVGADAIDYLIQINDHEYTINWQPQRAVVSSTADLGFTYGVYALHPHQEDTTYYGTYVNVWKKQANGKWKLALDSSNEGIETTE